MTYDKETSTIYLGPGSDFIADSGTHFVLTLKKLSAEKNAPADILSDWRVIEKWLGCAGREISQADEEKIGKAWRAYFAIGLAPSFGLQSIFDKTSEQYKQSGYSYGSDEAPTEVMDVFDRLLATKEDISAKRAHDIEVEKAKFQKVFKQLGKKQSLKDKIKSLSKISRIFVTLSFVWGAWVIFRTSDYYELFGVDLEPWNGDMFFANLVLPPLLAWAVYMVYRWISSGSK